MWHICIFRHQVIYKWYFHQGLSNFVWKTWSKSCLNKKPTGLIAPPFIIGFMVTENLPKVQTLLKITHLASMKSCLVIICPNSYEKLAKVKSGQIGVGLNIAQNHHLTPRKSYMAIIWPNSHEKLIKIKIWSSWSRFEHCSESLI